MKIASIICGLVLVIAASSANASNVQRDLKVAYQSAKTLDELTSEFLKFRPLFNKLEREGTLHHKEALEVKRAWSRIFDMRVVLNTLFQTYHGAVFGINIFEIRDARLIQYSSLLHLVNSGARISKFLWKLDKTHKLLNEAHPAYPVGSLVSFENEIFSIYSSLPKKASFRKSGQLEEVSLPTLFPQIKPEAVEKIVNFNASSNKSFGAFGGSAGKLQKMNVWAKAEFDLVSRPFVSNIGRQWRVWKRYKVFGFKRLFTKAVKKVSVWLGDTKVKLRDENYYNGKTLINLRKARAFERKLMSGDIVISRTNWFLSNAFLPGFWPHSQIYIGDFKKLSRLDKDFEVRSYYRAQCAKLSLSCDSFVGFLEKSAETKSAFRDYRKKTKLGLEKVVIEATSDGVHFSSVRHSFLNDFLGAMRPRVSNLSKAQAIQEAMGFFGAPYDFEFDFDTHNALVCTELTAKSYMPFKNKKGVTFDYQRSSGKYVEEYLNRYSLPVIGILRKMVDENVRYERRSELEFVGFLRGVPSRNTAVESSEREFYDSLEWPKWSFMQ